MKLNAHLIHAGGRQLNAPLSKLVPVILIQNAAALAGGGKHVVVGPQKEEILRGVAVVSGHAADLHLVQGDGNGTYGILGEHLPEQTGELLQVHGLVPQNFHKLVQHAAEDLPELGGLLRLLKAARLGLGSHLAFQGVLKVQFLQKAVERPYLGSGGLAGFQPLRQTGEGGLDPVAQRVYLGQILLPGGGPGGPVAVGILHPIHIPKPHTAVDLPLEDVVFKPVAFLRAQARKAGLQPAKHIVVLIAAAGGVQDPGEKAEGRFFQDVAAAAEIGGDLVALEDRLNGGLVVLNVPGGHRNVPAAARSLRQKAADGGGGLLHLGEKSVGLEEPDLGNVPFIGGGAAKKVTLQMAQGRDVLAFEHLHFHSRPLPLRQTAKAVQGAKGRLEYLLPAVGLPQEGDGERVGLPEKDGEAPALLGREVGEAVHINILAPGVARRLQTVAKPGHPVSGVQTGTEKPGLIGGVQKA